MALATIDTWTPGTALALTQPVIEPVNAELEMAVELLEISTPEHAQQAANMIQEIACRRRAIEELFSDSVSAAHKAHKALTEFRKKALAPYEAMDASIRRMLTTWRVEQERIAAEAERQAREKARLEQEAEQKRLADIAQAAAEQGDMETAAEAEAAAEIVPMVFAPPAAAPAQKLEGVSFRETWKFEVTDLMQLVKAVAGGQASIGLLQANETAIGGMVRSLKSAAVIPGVRVYSSSTAAVR